MRFVVDRYVRPLLDEGLSRDWFMLRIGSVFVEYQCKRIECFETPSGHDTFLSSPDFFYPGVWVMDIYDAEDGAKPTPRQFSRGFGIQLGLQNHWKFPSTWEDCAEVRTIESKVALKSLPEFDELLNLLRYFASDETPALMIDRAETVTVHRAWQKSRFKTCPLLIRCDASVST